MMKLFGILSLGLMLAGTASVYAAPTATAILAGGCFWTMQTDMTKMPGQTNIIVGYTGGTQPNPTYETYHDGSVPHVEAVQMTYDPAKISYAGVLDYYFHHVDATDGAGQFCDRGDVYRPVIFYATEAEHQTALAKKAEVAKLLNTEVKVEILPAQKFWPAEEYHQNYSEKNPLHYHAYRAGCGKDARIRQLWPAQN